MAITCTTTWDLITQTINEMMGGNGRSIKRQAEFALGSRSTFATKEAARDLAGSMHALPEHQSSTEKSS
jgi:hypothetical protein